MPLESIAAPVRPHSPPLFGLNVITLWLRIVEIHGPHLIRIAGAALRRGGEDHVVPEIQRIGFAVGIAELKRRRDVFAIRDIQRMQLAVAGQRVDGPLARCVRRRRSPESRSGPEGTADRRVCRAALGVGYSKCFFQRSLPVSTSIA